MSSSHFPKVSITEKMAEWRAANPEERAAMAAEHMFRIGNAVSELQESRRRHHERITFLEDHLGRNVALGKMRNPDDSASFVITELELKKAKAELEKHEEADIWLKRMWIGGLVSILVALAISTIVILAKVIAKAALGG
jgi:hypothetical protein